MFLKGAAEYAFRGKPRIEADILYRKPGIFQKIAGCHHTCIVKVFMGGKSGFFLKDTDEMVLA